jgi:hypothetical protein
MMAWLLLYVGTLVHALTLYGFDGRDPRSLVLLLPLAGLPCLVMLQRRAPRLFDPWPVKISGLIALGLSLTLLRLLYLDYWDTHALLPNLLVAGLGIASLWASLGPWLGNSPAHWLWIGLWLLSGYLDPLMPFLGAGLSACARGFEWLVDAPRQDPATPLNRPFLAFFALGLVLPKPWWDWGLNPDWALAMACFGAGVALLQVSFCQRRLTKVPSWVACTVLVLLFVLYVPQLLWLWGLALGCTWSLLQGRMSKAHAGSSPGLFFVLGLVISFALHNNLWLPGLRHVLWIGN